MTTAAEFNPSADAGDARLDEIRNALLSSDVPKATALAREALDAGQVHPLLLHLRAHQLQELGRANEALLLLHQACDLSPADPLIRNAIGECLVRLGRHADAIAAADFALQLNPELARARFTKGLAYEMLGELKEAEFCFRQASQLDPSFADAYARLAAISSRRSDWLQCRAMAGKALELDPPNSIALFALATADLAEGALAEAELRLRTVLENPRMNAHERANARSMLGDIRDRQDRTTEAFDLYRDANLELENFFAPVMTAPEIESSPALMARLSQHFRETPDLVWTRRDPPARSTNDTSAGLVFIVGYPRSGTTLLGQILAAHPGAVTLEEKAPLVDAIRDLFDDPQGIRKLVQLSDAELSGYRDAYWRHVRNFGLHLRDRILVDKQPLNLLRLPLISRIFPEAKIVLAIRDPRDVVLSCFRRLFNMHPFTYQLLTLSGTAESYSAAMELLETFRAKLPLNLLEMRNEDVVADFDAHIGKLCSFVGLDWRPSLRSFGAHSRRQHIATPSANQVARGLSAEGVEQWRRYRGQLAPVLPILQPWVERYGYPAE